MYGDDHRKLSKSGALVHLEVKARNLFLDRASVVSNRDMHWWQRHEIRALHTAIRALREDLGPEGLDIL